jgi:hypothetical protein
VDGVTTVASSNEVIPINIPDAREIPLALLAADANARTMVADVIESMEGPSHVRVAIFHSAI